MAADPAQIIARADRLAGDRSTFNWHWEDIRRHILPFAKSATTQSQTPGIKLHQFILDSTGEQAADLLAAALHGMLTNPATPWFELRCTDDRLNQEEEAAVWLEDAQRRMYGVYNSPHRNFAPQQHEKYLDLVCFGTGCMYIADRAGAAADRGPVFSTRPLAEIFLDENTEGRVDTVYRRFELSARQAVQKWQGKVGEKIGKAAQDPAKCDDKFEFIHAVFPRADRAPGRKDRANLPFASVWVSLTDKALLDEGGYHEMPYATPRWSKRSGEVFGRGPGMKALADVRMLQRTMTVTINGAEKMIDPSLMVADDGVLSPVRMTPSSINWYRAGTWSMDPIKPILTGGKPDLGEDLMKGIRQRIEAAFLNHLLQTMRDPRMTATQVVQLAEETVRILNPVLGRLQSEDLGTVIDRTFNVMLRGGMFLPVPKALKGQPIRAEYVSPVAKAQRLAAARGIAQTMELMAPMIQARPELLDNADLDKTFRYVADLMSWPKDCMRATDQVTAMRNARQQTAQAAQGKQDMMGAAQAGAQVMQALPAMTQAFGSPNQSLTPSSPTAGAA